MNSMTTRQRKFVYMGLIILLIVPIVWLGRPADSPTPESGGLLAQARYRYELGEATLGDVDPASATMNLVLLGMRGIASNLLWMQAEEEKKTKNFLELERTVESIIKLQPHFRSVWSFQAWNLAYNVSAECDNVEDRYGWVKKGMKFLMRGTQRNDKVPELVHDTGDFFGKKIGRADEHVQFRKFFLVDPDEDLWKGGADLEVNPDGLDNYLVARDWYSRANTVLDQIGGEQHKLAEPLFRSYPWRSEMDFATARQDEGKFGDITREAWATAYRNWTTNYGRTPFQTPGGKVTLEGSHDDLADLGKEDGVSLEQKIYWQGRYQDMTGYRYWRLRCLIEGSIDDPDQSMPNARRLLYEGKRKFREDQDLVGAQKDLYDGLLALENALRRWPQLTAEEDLVETGIKGVLLWQHVLVLLKQPVPEVFPMMAEWNNPEREALRQKVYDEFTRWIGE